MPADSSSRFIGFRKPITAHSHLDVYSRFDGHLGDSVGSNVYGMATKYASM